MNSEEGVGDERWFAPLSCLDRVMRFNVAVDCDLGSVSVNGGDASVT